MSCIAVLITQHITSDLKAATQLRSIISCRNIILTKIHRFFVCHWYCFVVKIAARQR
jgi:hypothetical protein